MPQPYDYTVQQPNVSTYFDAMRQGRADRMTAENDTRMNALAKYLPGALEGDKDQQALAVQSAPVDQMASLKATFSTMDAQKLEAMRQNQGRAAALAQWADTPEKWAVANAEMKKAMPGAPDIPFEQRGMVIAKAQTVAEALKAAHDEKMLANDTSRTTAQNALTYAQMQAVKADASRKANTRPGIDPFTGARAVPAGVQGRDTAQLQKYETTADAFTGIAQTLRNAAGALSRIKTGPGTGLARMAASPFATFGVESANQFVADYDAVFGASLEGGIEKLKGIGGSDTERELLTAIQTGLQVETPSPENQRRMENAIAAAEIASQRARLATEWANKFGSLTYTAPNGMTWQGFWSQYQKEAWNEHRRNQGQSPGPQGGVRPYREEQRQLLNGTAPQGVPPPPPGFEVR